MGGRKYSEKADIYSAGICLWEIYTQQQPYSDQLKLSVFKLFVAIMEEMRPTIPEEMPKSYAALMKRCWAQEHKKHPSAAEVEQRLKPIVEEHIAQESFAYSVT